MSAADPVFASYTRNFFEILAKFIPQKIFARLTISAVLFVVFSPLLLLRSSGKFINPLIYLKRYSFIVQMSVVMVLVASVVGVFLIIQFPYVFVRATAETSLSRFGVATYSEYVKRGFVELLFISSIIYSLVWAGLIILGKKQPKPILYYIQLIVLSEFVVFLFSIARRIYLYQAYHGLSLVRIYGILFLVWLFIITLTLFLRHLKQKTYITTEIVLTVLLLLLFGLFNAENYIALKNPPHVNNRIDYMYLAKMSPDGVNGWKKSYLFAREVLENKKLASKDLINRENRRGIAYAGVVVSRLLMNYHFLVNHYGTLKEWNDASLSVYRSMLNSNFEGQNSLKNQDILKRIEALKKAETRKHPGFYVTPYFPMAFTDGNNPHSFYTLVPENRFLKSGDWDGLDALFSWNRSASRAYRIMEKDIPLERLLQLHSDFFTLYRRIFSQAENEKDFDLDVSLSTPFL